jgi:hypothetical protein
MRTLGQPTTMATSGASCKIYYRNKKKKEKNNAILTISHEINVNCQRPVEQIAVLYQKGDCKDLSLNTITFQFINMSIVISRHANATVLLPFLL